MKVLINTPDTKMRGGGVLNYYATLRPYFSHDVEYFPTGKRDNENVLRRVLRMGKDYCSFLRKLIFSSCDLVVINPSLRKNSLLRDVFFLLIAKALGKKVMVFFRGWDRRCEKKIQNRFLTLFEYSYFKAEGFIVLADEFRRVLKDWGYDGPIFLETTVVADDFIHPPRSEQKDVKGRNILNILFLSRIEKAKGIYEVLGAYEILKKKYPFLTLTVAGTGTELENVRKYSENNNLRDVEFTGWVTGNTKKRVFYLADIYLFPSSHGEGMPNSVLEAMVCGLPVITRPVGGLKDFFENEKMGYITESKDPEVYADLIGRLIKNPEMRKTMAKYNANYATERFIASRVASRMKGLFEKVAEDSRKKREHHE